MRRIKNFIFLTMTCWALTACMSSSDCFREDVTCAALVTDTLGIEDHGINQDAWAGLQQAQADGLADQVDYIESIDARDYLKNIAYFAERGYDVIFTSGIALDDATLQSADLYPDSVFVGINQPFEESRPNLLSVTFPKDQMGFAAGASAAHLTKTGIVGAVCETSGIDAMWRYCEGFRAGAAFVNPEVRVVVLYRDDGDREKLFIDEDWGYETGVSQARRGVDVLFAAGGVTAQAALRAAVEYGVLAIGAERDQVAALGIPTSSVVTSFYGDASFEVQDVMRLVQVSGSLTGAKTGLIRYVALNPVYSTSFSGELDILMAALRSGQTQTNVSNSR